jgi:hypothetical protein
LVAKLEENRRFGRLRSRWEIVIRMYVKEIDGKSVGWIHVAQHRAQ